MSFDPWRAELIPLLCVVMVLTIAYQQVIAALTGLSLALILVLSNGFDTGEFVAILGAICVAIVSIGQVSSRSKLIKVGIATAGTYFLLTMTMGVIVSQRPDRLWVDHELFWHALRGAGWCIAAGYLVAGSLPFIESTFGVVTDISLLELSDVSHPLLQELVRRLLAHTTTQLVWRHSPKQPPMRLVPMVCYVGWGHTFMILGRCSNPVFRRKHDSR